MINIDVVNIHWPRTVTIDINDLGDRLIENQAPPGPPPREGLRWKPQTHRWIRPKTGAVVDAPPSGFASLERRIAKNDLFKAWGEIFREKINKGLKEDISSPEYEQFYEVFSWLMGISGPSGRSAKRIKMAKGDPEGSYVFQDYRNAVSMALVGGRYPNNNNAPIPKRHVRKIIDITLSTESKEIERDAISLGEESRHIAGRMSKPSPRYQSYSKRGWQGAKLTGSKMELFDVENRNQRTPYDFAQTVVHEMAHGVYFDLPFWYRVRIEHLYAQAVKGNNGLPSQYAKENDHEFFSECYTAYVTETDAFRERNPSMASELDILFNKTLRDRIPQRGDAIAEYFQEVVSGFDVPSRDSYIAEHEGDLRAQFPDWSDEMVAEKFGLTLEEYEMHLWNRDNWPTDEEKSSVAIEETLVFMVEKTIVSEDPIVIEDPEDAIGFTEDLPNADPIDMPAISEDSFADEEEEELELQAPPGAPPRYGLVWKPSTHRWIRPEEFDVPDQPIHQLEEAQRNQIQQSLDDTQDQTESYGRNVVRKVNDEISEVVKGFGFVEAQSPIQEEIKNIKEKTTRAIQTVINNPETAVWTRIPEANLRKILGEGIFRTSHETGKTAPGKPAATGGKLQGYLDRRKRIETSNFGEDANPIYAYLSDHEEGKLRERKVYKSRTATSSPKDHYEDVAVMYGNMRVKLKPQVRQKTTITSGDSYDNVGELYHQFMSDIDYRMFPGLFGHLAITQTMSEDFHNGYKRGMEAHFPRKPEQKEALRKGLEEFESRIENGEIKLKDLTYNYIEAQVHGGLSVNDIEEIIIDYRWNKSAHQLDVDEDGNPNVSPQLLKRLDDLGISWRFGSMPSKENIYKMMLVGELWNQ